MISLFIYNESVEEWIRLDGIRIRYISIIFLYPRSIFPTLPVKHVNAATYINCKSHQKLRLFVIKFLICNHICFLFSTLAAEYVNAITTNGHKILKRYFSQSWSR